MAADGFTDQEARVVINTYKAYFSKHPAGGDWLGYVTANTIVKDPERAKTIMRRYRRFYGK